MPSQLERSARDFEVSWSEASGTLRLKLSGSLDAESAPVLTDEFERSLAAGRTSFELDLESIGMISSAGVGSLIAGVGEARDSGGTVRVVGASEAVHHVFALLGLLDYLDCPTTQA